MVGIQASYIITSGSDAADYAGRQELYGLCGGLTAHTNQPMVQLTSAVRVACTGNLCFGKCGILHCSQWGVQSINFPYTQHGMFQVNATEISCIQNLKARK